MRDHMEIRRLRVRWSAIGAAIAVTLGGGGLMGVQAASNDGGAVFTSIDPVRMLDTRGRSKVGAIDGSGAPLRLQVTGDVVPAGASAVQMNVTVVDGEAAAVGGFVTVYPCDIARPNTSNLNFVNGQTVPNAATVPLAADGSICFHVYGRAHLLADVVGYHDDARLSAIEAELGQLRAAAIEPGSDAVPEPVDLSDYYRRAETDAAINAAVATATSDVVRAGDLDGFADTASVEDAIDAALATITVDMNDRFDALPDPGVSTGDRVASYGRVIDTRGRAEHSSAAVWTTAGVTPDITVGADGLALIVHHDPGRARSYLTRCADIGCTTASSNLIRSDHATSGVSLALANDGLPIIASTSSADDARLIISSCDTPSCLGSTNTTVDSGAFSGYDPSLAIGVDGLPIVAHIASGDPAVTHCGNVTCATSSTNVVDLTGLSADPDLTIRADGTPIIAITRPDGLAVIACADQACSATSGARLVAGPSIGVASLGVTPAIAIGVDGAPVIAHRGALSDGSSGLFITTCNDADCTTATTQYLSEGGIGADVVIGLDGRPLIAHVSAVSNTLQITTCATNLCASADTDNTGITASDTAAMIDASGNLATALHVATGATSTIEMHRRTHRSFTAGGWDH